jgi:hypothetical protein
MSDLSFLESNDVTGDDLKTLSTLCDRLKEKRKEIALMELQLKSLKETERKLGQEEIPNLLFSKGISSLSLEDGSTVTVRESVKVSIAKTDKQKRAEAFKWIIENGGAGIIKRELRIEEPEQQTITFLKDNSIAFDDKKDIHHSTLKAWFSSKLGISKNSLQEIEMGDVPSSINLFMYNETKIKGV